MRSALALFAVLTIGETLRPAIARLSPPFCQSLRASLWIVARRAIKVGAGFSGRASGGGDERHYWGHTAPKTISFRNRGNAQTS